jgi:hypothetical protein
MTTDNNAPADDVVARLREVERFYSTMHEQSGVAKVAAKAAAEIERLRAERDEALRACKAAFDSINRFPGSLHDRAMTKLEKALKGRNLDWRDPALTAAERDKERLLEALRGVIQVRDKAAFDAARTLIKEMEGNG